MIDSSTRPPPRPRRQDPAATRRRLIDAAAVCFNERGLIGVDAARIARCAGYSNGVFYKHFGNKSDALIAAYDMAVGAQWDAVNEILLSNDDAPNIARRIVDFGVALHARWRGLRAAMLALLATDRSARASFKAIRIRQLETLGDMQRERGTQSVEREADALLLATLERGYDALADGEITDLGMSAERFTAKLQDVLLRSLSPRANQAPADPPV